ncbi:MAG: ribonuclease HI family protein [Ktedonobacterales bacterium]|nr:ribonuclease HI family protein [Ktedonobacterales bacterium]
MTQPKTGQDLVLFTDGASRGNPGPAAAGIVIRTRAGEDLVATGRVLGRMTNNQAEYRALLLGLELALPFAPATLLVQMDSELVVKQMRGEYAVKSADLAPLHKQARGIVAQFARVQFAYIPRRENALADALANRALDAGKG